MHAVTACAPDKGQPECGLCNLCLYGQVLLAGQLLFAARSCFGDVHGCLVIAAPAAQTSTQCITVPHTSTTVKILLAFNNLPYTSLAPV
jgi:hypothetical protein